MHPVFFLNIWLKHIGAVHNCQRLNECTKYTLLGGVGVNGKKLTIYTCNILTQFFLSFSWQMFHWKCWDVHVWWGGLDICQMFKILNISVKWLFRPSPDFIKDKCFILNVCQTFASNVWVKRFNQINVFHTYFKSCWWAAEIIFSFYLYNHSWCMSNMLVAIFVILLRFGQ